MADPITRSRTGNTVLAEQYRDTLLHQERLSVVPMSPEIAELSAQLRADYTLRTPDSIQLATAINRGAISFLTNDKRLSIVPNLQILVLDELLSS